MTSSVSSRVVLETGSSGSTGHLLDIRGLSVRIGQVDVLTDVNLTMRPGEAVAVVGETGSGKSVTCRAVVGLLDCLGARVTAGEVEFDGIDLVGATAARWRSLRGKRVGFIPQGSIASLDPVMTVGRQLKETIRALDRGADPDLRARELLSDVRMPDPERVMSAYPHQLSGGMRQRVMIALGLAGRPELLVADEPTTALDATVQRSILDLLQVLRQEHGMALLLVTHDLQIAETYSDSIAVMYSGATVESGPARSVLAAPGHPYTRALLDARVSQSRRGERLRTLQGAPLAPSDRPSGCAFAPRCTLATSECTGAPIVLSRSRTHGHDVACLHSEEVVTV